ncbi:hypothetical protein [Stomatohabitans albus]
MSKLSPKKGTISFTDFMLEWALIFPMILGGFLGIIAAMGLINLLQAFKG